VARIFNLAIRDPVLLLGVFLILSWAGLSYLIEFRMRRAGYGYNPFKFPRAFKYASVRGKHGWSPWPAYLVWPCLLGGIVLLAVGVTLLPK